MEPGKSGLHDHGEDQHVSALKSCYGNRGQDALKKDSRGLSRVGAGPSFPSTSAEDLRELPRVPLRAEGCCGVGGPSRDSAGFGAMEEGLILRGGRNLRLPLRFGLRPQGPCTVGT